MGMAGVARLALVDDHPVLLNGLGSIFAADSAFSVIGKGSSAPEAVAIGREHRPDVMIIDLGMPGNAIDAIASIVRDAPETKVVAFTASTDTQTAVDALDAGASAYVLKGSTIEELKEAIAAVLQGDTYISQDIAFKVIAALRSPPKRQQPQAIRLSVREEQVVRLLLSGKTNREIAEELGIGEKTVKHYMTILMQKLHVRNRLEVVIAAQHMFADRKSGSSAYLN
jgi:two-component system, NarL family, nitrate/nitrite response regulator NarL